MRNFLNNLLYLSILDVAKGTEVKKYYTFFKDSLNWSRKNIYNYQLTQVKKIITHAYRKIPYYKELFEKNNLTPEDIKDLEDLKKIPPLTREDIQNNFERLIAEDVDLTICYKGSSSGSTGKPVTYLHDKSASSAGRAAGYLGWSLAGWKFGAKGLHIWGNPNAVNVQWRKPTSRIKSRLFNIYRFPAYELTTEKKFEELVRLLNVVEFEYIDGYTNAIYLLAKYILENKRIIRKPKYILTTGENLHQYQKDIINSGLGKVFDCYGCGEINGISYQNIYNNDYLVIEPNVILEYDDHPYSSENERDLIITHLHNFVMPFIRYKNDDTGIQSLDVTGPIKFSRLKSISGRVSDIINLPNGGNLVVPSFFGSKLLRLVDCIKQYQVVRVSYDELIIKLVVDDKIDNNSKQIIYAAITEYLKDKIKWHIDYVDSIEVSKNGKYKIVIDRINEKNFNS